MEKVKELALLIKTQWLRSAVLTMLTTSIIVITLSFGESAYFMLTKWLQCTYHEQKAAGLATVGVLAKGTAAVIVMRFCESFKTLPPVAAAFYLFREEKNCKSNCVWLFGAWAISFTFQLGMGAWDVYRRTQEVANSKQTALRFITYLQSFLSTSAFRNIIIFGFCSSWILFPKNWVFEISLSVLLLSNY